MAYTTVVTGRFYNDLIEALRKISTKRGAFRIAMLIPSTAHDSETWNLVVSAVWLDSMNLRLAVSQVLDSLRQNLSDESFAKVQRVSVLRTGESFVTEATADLVTPIELGTAYRVQSFALSRFGVDEAIVLAASPPNPQNLGYRRINA